MSTKDKIREILTQTFDVTGLQITDDSDKHAGHKEAIQSGGGHFCVTLISNDFKGKKLIERHRMVYDALKENMGSDIHALALQTFTSEEKTT